jgi:hypothetical protein
MGFMDKAKKLAEQAQKEAKDGTLKERAKGLAEQALAKLDEVQTQFNDKQKAGGAPASTPGETAAPSPEATSAAAETVAEAAEPRPTAGDAPDVDRSHETAPKVTGGDPLAG